MTRVKVQYGLALLALNLPALAQACGACGCTLNADWASQGYNVGPGLRFDLREDYINQNQLWSGGGAVSRSAFALPADQEIQQKTVTHTTTLGLDYSLNYQWGVTVQLPYIDRYHTTVGEGDTEESASHTHGIGDVRVLGRYQGFTPTHRTGIQFGLKLPTGAFDETFSSGPAAGTPFDRGLQAGTGTTNALLGGFHYGTVSERVGYFLQGLAEVPLNSRAGFKPGDVVNASAGLRWLDAKWLVPQIQLNAHWEDRESGDLADVNNSGARQLFVSPGVNLNINSHFGAYAFAQLPIYQHVRGLQLEPQSQFSVGVHYRL